MPEMRRHLIFLLLFAPLIECFSRAPSASASASASAITASGTATSVLQPYSWDLSTLKSLWPQLGNGIVLLVRFDGSILAVNATTRESEWVLSSGGPTYGSYQDVEYFNNGSGDRFYIELGQHGALYSCNRNGKQKLSFTAEEFIRDTPYSAGDGGLTTGSRRSIAFYLDADTGNFISDSHDNQSNLVVQTTQSGPSPKMGSGKVAHPLYITRTDYEITHRYHGKVVWNLNFTAFQLDLQFSNTGTEPAPKQGGVPYFPYQMKTWIPPIHGPRSMQSMSVISGLPDRHAGDSSASKSSSHDTRVAIVGEILLSPGGGNDGTGILATYHESKDPRKSLPVIAGPTDRHPGGSFGLEPSPHDSLPAIFGEVPMPQRSYEEHGMLAAYRETKSTSIMADAGMMLQSVFLMFVTVFSIVVYIFRYPVTFGKQRKLKQVGVPKKKRTRRLGSNDKNANSEENMSNMSHGYKVGESKESIPTEQSKTKLLLSTDHVNGQIEGRRIGKLLVSSTEIAQGSNGTIVLEGIYDGRPVAVKRLVRTHHDIALKEVQNLIASDQHPNIVRWYGVEYDQDFVYLSLERCTCSLNDLIYFCSGSIQSQVTSDQDPHFLTDYTIRLHSIMESNKDIELWKENGYPSPQLLKLMSDLVSGLAHLHELGIIHRDLKPQNVLIIKGKSLGAKLSDMGISKRLHGDKSSITQHATGYGSSGWQAPEQLLHQRQTRAVDLFSLGCLLFFCITGGKHPYGDSIERDVNIVNDRKDLFLVDTVPEAVDLFTSLLNPNPDTRPTAMEVLHHPFFWSSETKLSFLRDASDRVELEDRETGSELLNSLECTAAVALNGKWDEKMESAFLNNIGRYRRYKFDSVRDLLRVIRNKLNHYRELPQEVQEILGPVPEGFECYFSSRFPRLLIEVYKVLYSHCKEEEFFSKYIKSNLI